MENNTKKCPMCAEIIPLAASACEFCGTRFEVSISGYCPKCHQVREADANGCCQTCDGEVIDPRVESHLVDEPPPGKPAPSLVERPPSTQPASSKAWLWALGAVLVLGAAALVWGLSPKLAPVIAPASATSIVTATGTAIPSPVPTMTRTPLPTATASPMPGWVTDFAQPLLLHVAGQEPDILDTFDDNSGGWRCLNWIRPSSREIIDGELVLDPCALSRGNMAFADFVLELDLRFLSGARSTDNFRIIFRNQASVDTGVPEAYKIYINPFGSIDVLLPPFDRQKIESQVEMPDPRPRSDHLVLIAKGPRIAFLYNGIPVIYLTDSTILRRGGLQFETYSSVAIDNLKIWDLSKIPVP